MMAGPYGITQVDVPGAMMAAEQMKANRIRMMVLQREMAKEERAEKTQTGIRSALERYSTGGISESGAPYGVATAASAMPPDPLAPLPAQPSAAPTPSAPQAGNRQQLLNELLSLDVDTAGKVMNAFKNMDEAQASAAKQRNDVLGRAAQHLMGIAPDQRRAELQRIAPVLIADGGITQEQLQGFDPSDDRQLQFVIGQARDIEKIIEASKPDYMNVNGEVIDKSALSRGEADPVRYRSEFIDTPQGLARRPNGGASNVPRIANTQDYERLPPGTVYIDPNGIQRTKGGASQSNGSQSFP